MVPRPRSTFQRVLPLILLCLLLPALMGSCEGFRDNLVNSVDTFTRSISNSIFDLFFDLFRTTTT